MIANRFQAFLLSGFLCVLGISLEALGQTEKSSGKPGDKPSITDDRRLPSATALGDIFFRSANSFVFSLGVQQSATDNLYFSPAGSVAGSDAQNGYIPFTSLSGRVAYQRQLQRTTFGLEYGASGLLFRTRDSGDFLSQDGGFQLSYRVTPRATLSFGDRLSVAPAPGRFFRRDSVLPSVPSQILPNNTLFVGLNRTIANTGLAGFSYQLSRRSQLSLGALRS